MYLIQADPLKSAKNKLAHPFWADLTENILYYNVKSGHYWGQYLDWMVDSQCRLISNRLFTEMNKVMNLQLLPTALNEIILPLECGFSVALYNTDETFISLLGKKYGIKATYCE